jgi:flagellar basal body-associated protein FliL
MAFCNSCGATVDASTKFCNKCGAAVPAAAATPSIPIPPPQSAQGGGALKIILIVVAVIVGLGILGIGTAAFLLHKTIKTISQTHIEERNGNVRVETPFGTVESSEDADAATRNLGVEVYPGAKALKGTASVATIGGMHTAAAEFETSDPADKVAEFYKSQLPKANFVSSDGDHYAIMSTDKKNMITINIEPQNGKTRIHIANVSGKPPTDSDSD